MRDTVHPGMKSKPPIGLVFAIAAAACLAGGTLAFTYKEIALEVLTHLLQPGGNTTYLVPDSPLTIIHFPIKLFLVGSLFVAAPLTTAWLTSVTYRQYARMSALLLASSVVVSGAAFVVYRQYMQVEVTELRIAGKLVPSRLRGQITPLGEVPIGTLALSGPLLASTFFLWRRRRTVRVSSS